MERPDLLGRFTPTPHRMDLQLMQRTVRLETNNRAILDVARQYFERHQHGKAGAPEFAWRIICEGASQLRSTAAQLSAFSDPGLAYVNIGQRGFLALDLDSREAVGYLSEASAESNSRFKHRPPLDILFCVTMSSLGITALSGACVGIEDRGVLIFGPPNSGKTTASYLAAKTGLEYHADQVVFLDNFGERSRAWGDPFPAVFRTQSLKFLPELTEGAHRSTYADLSFLYFDKSTLQAPEAHPINPICSVFLERRLSCELKLQEIGREDALPRLQDSLLFDEDARFDAQTHAALRALVQKPAYNLQYDSDPNIAARVIKDLLR